MLRWWAGFGGALAGVAAVGALLAVALPSTAAGGGQYAQQGAKLVPSDEFPGSAFGQAVAVSSGGSTALIGGAQDADGLGATWVYTRSGSSWSEQAKLAPPGNPPFGQFGTAVALSADGNTALVSAPRTNPGAAPTGTVYAFTRSGSSWSASQTIEPSDEGSSRSFGTALALSANGDTLLVSGTAGSASAVWIYTWTGSAW